MCDVLVALLAEYKAEQELIGKDFMSDLVTVYKKLREKMAEQFPPEDFGPVSISPVDDNMNTNLLTKLRVEISIEKKQIKTGYDRVKEKVKSIRQDYRKAVTDGRRSGSGKIVCDHWDTLKTLWGGSPAVNSIQNSISSLENDQKESNSATRCMILKKTVNLMDFQLIN